MVIRVKFVANADQLVISLPQANLHEEVNAVVAYRVKRNKKVVLAYSNDVDLLANNSSETSRHSHSDIQISHPFGPQAFNADLAVRLLSICLFIVASKMKRPWLLTDIIDRFDCELEISGYETLSSATQLEFECLIWNSTLWHIQRLTINGQDIAQVRYQQNLTLGVVGAVWLFWYLILLSTGWAFFQISYPEWMYKQLLGVECITFPVGIILILIGAAYVAYFLGVLSAILVLRRFVAGPMLKHILVGNEFGLPKLPLNWIINRLIPE